MDALVEDSIAARESGHYETALRLLLELFDGASRTPSRPASRLFITLFEWGQLADTYRPAYDALASARDAQVARLLDGDAFFDAPDAPWPRPRFRVILDMNDMLKDKQASYHLFLALLTRQPALAQGAASLALPAIVDAGDFSLAERYLPDPLARLEELNQLARALPLFAAPGAAPRLAGELNNFVTCVALCTATLQGLGRTTEAATLRHAALAGLASPEMQTLAARELDAPGAIFHEMQAYQQALEAAGQTAQPGPAPARE